MTHPRLRPRTFKQVLVRLTLYPLIASCLLVGLIGFTNPLAFHFVK